MQRTFRLGSILLLTLGMATAQTAFGQGGRVNHDLHDNDYGSRRHLDTLSNDLYTRANAICWEMHRNYDNNSGYKRAYSKAYDILMSSKRIKEVANSDRRYIKKDDTIERELFVCDRLFHDLESDVAGWTPDSRRRGGDLREDLRQYERSMHHMMRDYGISSKFDRRNAGRGDGRR